MHELDHAEDFAKTLANNHSKFASFAWSGKPESPQDWSIIYTSNRDSGLVEESNESVINATLKPFSEGDDPDVVFERHSHWACGYVDGFSIRVYRNGKITKAFEEYSKLRTALENYPLLDEGDYSNREYEAALESIEREAPNMIREPEGWQGNVFGWLYENEERQVENIDDQGASPSRASICRALEALKIGYECPGCDVIIQVNSPTEGHRNVCEWCRSEDKDYE